MAIRPTPTPPTRPRQAASNLFFDDFSDGDAAGWSKTTNGWGVTASKAGRTNVLDKTNTNDEQNLNGNLAWTDYTLSAWVNLGATTGEASILGRWSNATNYYELALGNGANKWTLRKVVGGTATTLGTGTFNFSVNSWYMLKLSMIGSTITASASTDGTSFNTLTTVTDTALTSGKIGVRGGNIAAAFDDILVV